MKKTMPKKIKIFSVPYKIIYKGKCAKDKKGNVLWGQTDYTKNIITIYYSETKNLEDLWQTLWHELIHIIASNLDLKIKDDENIISSLGTGINSILIDNKLFK